MILKTVQTKKYDESGEKSFSMQTYHEGDLITVAKTPDGLCFNVRKNGETDVLNIPPFDLEKPSDFAIYLMEDGKTIDSFHIYGDNS